MFSIMILIEVHFQDKDMDVDMGPFGKVYETWFKAFVSLILYWNFGSYSRV